MNLTLYSVSSLNRYIKQVFDNDFALRGLKLKGEVSNFKPYHNGHIYFTLKDESSSIKAVMFAEYTKFIQGPIKDGDEIIAVGYVSTYPARGEYQFYAQAIELAGAGQQLLELEILKKKLAAEGLFDASRKRPIPQYPRAIGVICAPNSAALSDIVKNLRLRNPLVDVEIFPSLVQGKDAPKALLNALEKAKNSNITSLIIGRGGGASEDLSAFNDEALVREVAKFPVPVISAVGHEIDVTLIDYVVDARASTPTGAAVMATVDYHEILETLMISSERMSASIHKRIGNIQDRLHSLKNRPFFIRPQTMYEKTLLELTNTKQQLLKAINHSLERRETQLNSLSNQLRTLSIDSTLSRGFTITKSKDGKLIRHASDVELGEDITTFFHDGSIRTKVIDKEI